MSDLTVRLDRIGNLLEQILKRMDQHLVGQSVPSTPEMIENHGLRQENGGDRTQDLVLPVKRKPGRPRKNP